jgi:low affinity Fe/Cu permease
MNEQTNEGKAKARVHPIQRAFSRFANAVATESGKPSIFVLSLLVVAVWAATGPIFHYSDTWQLVINTGTTIVTFLMVFLIQNSQNRDNAAIQVKLDELIRVSAGKNAFVGIEHLTDVEIERLRKLIEERAKHGSGRANQALAKADAEAEEAADRSG